MGMLGWVHSVDSVCIKTDSVASRPEQPTIKDVDRVDICGLCRTDSIHKTDSVG